VAKVDHEGGAKKEVEKEPMQFVGDMQQGMAFLLFVGLLAFVGSVWFVN